MLRPVLRPRRSCRPPSPSSGRSCRPPPRRLRVALVGRAVEEHDGDVGGVGGLMIGRQALASLGTSTMPSTLRVMKFFTCSIWRLASPSAMAWIILMLRLPISALKASSAATQNSVCSVSKETPMVGPALRGRLGGGRRRAGSNGRAAAGEPAAQQAARRQRRRDRLDHGDLSVGNELAQVGDALAPPRRLRGHGLFERRAAGRPQFEDGVHVAAGGASARAAKAP